MLDKNQLAGNTLINKSRRRQARHRGPLADKRFLLYSLCAIHTNCRKYSATPALFSNLIPVALSELGNGYSAEALSSSFTM